MSKIAQELSHLIHHVSSHVPPDLLEQLQTPEMQEAAVFSDEDDVAKSLLHIKLLDLIALDPLCYESAELQHRNTIEIATPSVDGHTYFRIHYHGHSFPFGTGLSVPHPIANALKAAIDSNKASDMYAAAIKSRSDHEKALMNERKLAIFEEAAIIGKAAANILLNPGETRLTQEQAKGLMHWELRKSGDIKTHILKFYESAEAKEQLKGSMAYAHVSIGDRSASAWTIDGDDRRFQDLREAKAAATSIALQRLARDGFVYPDIAPHVMVATTRAHAEMPPDHPKAIEHLSGVAATAFATSRLDALKSEKVELERSAAPGFSPHVTPKMAKFLCDNLIECAQRAQQWHDSQSAENSSRPRMQA